MQKLIPVVTVVHTNNSPYAKHEGLDDLNKHLAEGWVVSRVHPMTPGGAGTTSTYAVLFELSKA